jgi:C-terminal processing protease CtpA/Prc
MRRAILVTIAGTIAISVTCAGQQQPPMDKVDRGRAEIILDDVHGALEKHYYDQKFHGVDLPQRYEQYKKRMGEAATWPDALRVVAAFLAGLKDSHTFFVPPRLTGREDYGYIVQIIGDRCYVTHVRPGTDAATKLHPGDEVLGLNGYTVNRDDWWQLSYALNQLQPVAVTVIKRRTPDGPTDQLQVNATLTTGKKLHDLTFSSSDTDFWNILLEEERRIHQMRQSYVEKGDLMIWKMPEFFMPQDTVAHMIGLARKHKALILDLRGNPGGNVQLLEEMVGSLIDHETQIAQRVGRKPMKPAASKKTGEVFSGDLIVLVDSGSASAAELLARTMQLNHRGTVIGDRTSGKVMEARFYSMREGSDRVLFYGASITDADLIMADGQSLENRGVTPDETVLPTGADLAAGRDPVMVYAAAKLGVKLDPKAAGALFPFEWTPLGD